MSNITRPMYEVKTVRMDSSECYRLTLSQNSLTTEKDRYEIDLNKRIGMGGESQIYKAKRVSDGLTVAIKIHDTFNDDPLSRKNRSIILDFLYKHADYKNTHIMPLLDDGFIELKDIESGDSYSRPLDIIPFCEFGHIEGCDYQKLKNKIIPEVLHAINLLHSNSLVHRDIKPCNIYLFDDCVLLADFGTTSKVINVDSHGKTITRKGTPGYTAPEISDSYYVIASDYYSLGCTIATLYNGGSHVYQKLLDVNDISTINFSLRQGGLPLDCPENENDIQILVNSLIIREEKKRANYHDVLQWINNAANFVATWHGSVINTQKEQSSLIFKFEGIECKSRVELTEAILKNWEKGKQYLYRDIFRGFFNTEDPALANNIYEVVEEVANHDLGLAMFLHYLNYNENKMCPIYWCGECYEKLSDISTAIFNNIANQRNIEEMLKSGFLSWKYKQVNFSNLQSIESLESIEEITRHYQNIGYYLLMYCSLAGENLQNNTPDDIFIEITSKQENMIKKISNFNNDDKLIAYLIFIGHQEPILNFKRNISSNESNNELLFYTLFENICKTKGIVKEHYLKFGTLAYTYWIQQNIHLYKFNGSASKKIENDYVNIFVDKKSDINEIHNNLQKLKVILNEFYKKLQNNYILTHLGINCSLDINGITTNYSFAFFISKLSNNPVPIGFFKSDKNIIITNRIINQAQTELTKKIEVVDNIYKSIKNKNGDASFNLKKIKSFLIYNLNNINELAPIIEKKVYGDNNVEIIPPFNVDEEIKKLLQN